MCTLQAARRLINTQLTTVMNRAGDYHGRGHQGTITVDVTALDMVMQDYAKLRAKTEVSMGVGDGSGKLFVHGDYDSIKAAQAIIDRYIAAMGFISEVSKQKPEKPDYWSGCSQCERNIEEAKELTEVKT